MFMDGGPTTGTLSLIKPKSENKCSSSGGYTGNAAQFLTYMLQILERQTAMHSKGTLKVLQHPWWQEIAIAGYTAATKLWFSVL